MANVEKLTKKEELELEKEKELILTEDDIISILSEERPLPTRDVSIDRLGFVITLRALTEKDISTLRKDCTHEKKARGGRKEKVFDDEEFNIALIEKSAINPDFNGQKLLKALKLSSGREVIRRKFLAGEMAQLGDHVLELSGFDDELEDVTIKN